MAAIYSGVFLGLKGRLASIFTHVELTQYCYDAFWNRLTPHYKSPDMCQPLDFSQL